MATRVRPEARPLHEQDFYVWTQVQAEHLRARRFDALDLDHLIEEVEDLGDVRKNAVLSNASVVMEHLLKLQFSPAQYPRVGWAELVVAHRTRIEIDLTPRLRQILAEDLPPVYAITRQSTARRLRLHREDAATDALPATCP